MPEYVTYKDDTLILRKGKVVDSCLIPSNIEDGEKFKLVVAFLRKFVGLSSSEDNILNKKKIADKQKDIKKLEYNCWKDIKKVNIKDTLLHLYMQDLSVRYNLTNKEYQLLQANLTIATLFKYIDNNTVIMANNKIDSIVDFDIVGDERGNRTFTFPVKNVTTKSTHSKCEDDSCADNSKDLTSAWGKYLEDIKKLIKHNHNIQPLLST